MKCEVGTHKSGFQIVLIPEDKADQSFVQKLYDAGLCEGALKKTGGKKFESINMFISEKGVVEEMP